MKRKLGIRYRLLRGWALQSRNTQHLLRRLERAMEDWTGAVLRATLADREKEMLTVDLYDVSFRAENDHDGLYEWERRWFERRLPRPPASILVGAAGAGREAAALQKMGYQVHAFEPSASAFRLCREILGPDHADRASYRDLIATVLLGQPTPLQIGPDSRFDAVLLGWGSFGHVLRPADRFDLLRACDRIAPAGPILLSIFHPQTAGARGELAYTSWGGFLAAPPVEELEEQARALNREVVVSLGTPSWHATLIPSAK